jgi:hypothetical protein
MTALAAIALTSALAGEVVHTGTVRVALPPDEAIELFTAKGEIGWVPGWQPHYVTPPDGSPLVGGVWLTGHGEDETIWRVQKFDRATHEAEYLRITPGNRVVTVQVRLAADGEGSLVTVSYRALAISEDGQAWVDAFTAERYAAMMREWQDLIAAHLAAR